MSPKIRTESVRVESHLYNGNRLVESLFDNRNILVSGRLAWLRRHHEKRRTLEEKIHQSSIRERWKVERKLKCVEGFINFNCPMYRKVHTHNLFILNSDYRTRLIVHKLFGNISCTVYDITVCVRATFFGNRGWIAERVWCVVCRMASAVRQSPLNLTYSRNLPESSRINTLPIVANHHPTTQ